MMYVVKVGEYFVEKWFPATGSIDMGKYVKMWDKAHSHSSTQRKCVGIFSLEDALDLAKQVNGAVFRIDEEKEVHPPIQVGPDVTLDDVFGESVVGESPALPSFPEKYTT